MKGHDTLPCTVLNALDNTMPAVGYDPTVIKTVTTFGESGVRARNLPQVAALY